MTVSKRLRFEVLRRDNHACRYCGAKAPDVKLAVDHVIPETLGGRDEPENLVTACEACNSGKSSVSPGSPVVADVKQDAIRWVRAIELSAAILASRVQAENDYVKAFFDAATVTDGASTRPTGYRIAWPPDWELSIRKFYQYGVPREVLDDAYWRTDANPKIGWTGGWRYFCGIIWSTIREMREMATDVLAQQEASE